MLLNISKYCSWKNKAVILFTSGSQRGCHDPLGLQRYVRGIIRRMDPPSWELALGTLVPNSKMAAPSSLHVPQVEGSGHAPQGTVGQSSPPALKCSLPFKGAAAPPPALLDWPASAAAKVNHPPLQRLGQPRSGKWQPIHTHRWEALRVEQAEVHLQCGFLSLLPCASHLCEALFLLDSIIFAQLWPICQLQLYLGCTDLATVTMP